MHSQLRERIRLMRARLDNAAPVAEIRAESQLFVTPAPVCDRLVTLAEISNRDHKINKMSVKFRTVYTGKLNF